MLRTQKKKMIQINENKTNINWLACIYDVHHLKHYKMGTFKKRDLASFNKKEKNNKKQGKIYSFLIGIRVLACSTLTHYIKINKKR